MLFTNRDLFVDSTKAKLNDSPVLIKLRDIVKTFFNAAGNFTALNGVSLEIMQGEFISIIGKSGSGKTTLLNILTGIDRPTKGEIYIGNTALHKLSDEEIAVWRGQNIGIVFQFFQLLPALNVIENIILPMELHNILPRSERFERAKYLLELVGLSDQSHKFPNKLSGGQQQRAAIARALANDPPIIISDEPTGNLDGPSAEKVIQLFEDLVKYGKTILMVTHNQDLAKRTQRTIVISDGEIVDSYRTNRGKKVV